MEPKDQALEVVKAQASVRPMTTQEMTEMLKELTHTIYNLSCNVEEATKQDVAMPECKNSIKEKSITCCICGKQFKVITKKHLEKHGVTPAEYREQFGIKKSTALAAKELTRARRKKMQDMELWKRKKDTKSE